jgi:hypothetical protein
MFNVPPPAAKTHWVYDDPSGVAEPTPYPRPWRRRRSKRTALVTVVPNRVVRVSHMEN